MGLVLTDPKAKTRKKKRTEKYRRHLTHVLYAIELGLKLTFSILTVHLKETQYLRERTIGRVVVKTAKLPLKINIIEILL